MGDTWSQGGVWSRGELPGPRGVPGPRGCGSRGCLVPGGGDPPRWLLLRAVRILLECILVKNAHSLNFTYGPFVVVDLYWNWYIAANRYLILTKKKKNFQVQICQIWQDRVSWKNSNARGSYIEISVSILTQCLSSMHCLLRTNIDCA